MTDQDLLVKTLKNANLSVTKSRLTIFNALNNCEPQSMHDLILKCSGAVDKASMYRNIELFEKLGIVQRLHIGWKYKLELTDIYSHHHHHISCLGCNKVVPIKEHDAVERMIEQLASRSGIKAERHQLEIQGYCSSCQQ